MNEGKMKAAVRFTIQEEALFARKILQEQSCAVQLYKEASAYDAWILYVPEHKAIEVISLLSGFSLKSMEALIGLA